MAPQAPPSPESPRLAKRLDRYLSVPMFVLSLLYLMAASGVIHRLGDGLFAFFEVQVIVWCLIILWPIFALESLLRFLVTRNHLSFWRRFGILFAVFLFPWARFALRSYVDVGKLWLPGLGWQVVDRSLRRRLERFFSVPMIVFALMVLPVLSLEYFWEQEVRAHFGLGLALDVANSLIWMAFAIEFTLLVSVADKKIAYCIQNWMDLAVVALPIIDFLPVLRLWQLSRLVQLNQIGRLGRLYRLRGLFFKAWRAFLLLEMINRLLGNYKERRLRKLRDLIAAKQMELDELRQEQTELEQQVAKEKTPPAAVERGVVK